MAAGRAARAQSTLVHLCGCAFLRPVPLRPFSPVLAPQTFCTLSSGKSLFSLVFLGANLFPQHEDVHPVHAALRSKEAKRGAEGRRSAGLAENTVPLAQGPFSGATPGGCWVEGAHAAVASRWPGLQQPCAESLSAMELLLRQTCHLETGDLGLEAGGGSLPDLLDHFQASFTA